MKNIKLADIDLAVVATNAGNRPERLNPANQIIRHQFMEVWIRLCYERYVKNQADGKDMTTRIGMELMFDKYLYPIFKNYDSHTWRRRHLWTEPIDYIIKIVLPGLKDIYKKCAGSQQVSGNIKTMSVEEFKEMVESTYCLSEKFGSKQLAIYYNLSMMTQLEEVEMDRHLNMSFIEFIEAVVRVAEKVEIPNLMIDQGSVVGMEIDEK